MASPTSVQPQFQTWDSISNVDRCNKCGAPRSAHGPDWTCLRWNPDRLSKALYFIGGLLALIGVMFATSSGSTALDVFGVACLLLGTMVGVVGAVRSRRRI